MEDGAGKGGAEERAEKDLTEEGYRRRCRRGKSQQRYSIAEEGAGTDIEGRG